MWPGIQQGALRQLDSRVKSLWRVESVILSLVLGAAALIADVVTRDLPFHQGIPVGVLAGVAFLLVLGWSLRMARLSHDHWVYQLRQDDLLVAYGVFWRTKRFIPRNRIQHVDIQAGPIARMIGIATLSVFVGGRGGAAASIPGLDPGEAEQLRLALLPNRVPPPVIGQEPGA